MRLTSLRLGMFAALGLLATLAFAPNPALADCQTGSCWGALAAGISDNQVSIGSAMNLSSPNEAGWAAVIECQKNGISCGVVGPAFQGCGFITSGTGNGRVAWGSGSTAQTAYNQCMSYGGVRCKTQTIGGCNGN